MKSNTQTQLSILIAAGLLFLWGCHSDPSTEQNRVASDRSGYTWLAGDHHIHSQYSVDWDERHSPPAPIIAGDAIYSAQKIAQQARRHGLDWMVITDHGGPNHSQINLDLAYPDLLNSREAFPDLIQFYGMEFDTPGARHSSLIIPFSKNESKQLFELERSFNRREPYPSDPSRHTEEKMLEALKVMASQKNTPLLIANHPGRSATGLGEYTDVTPTELRKWNTVAPNVAIGMEGAPGHQAATLFFDGSIKAIGQRGGYRHFPTMGGFDQMTALLGGFWDSMLGERRRWWITANSDSHIHYTEGHADFWPGEYSKTYVYAKKEYDSILEGLRQGRVFVVTGDLIRFLELELISENGNRARVGESLIVKKNENVRVRIRFKGIDGVNAVGHRPEVARVDLIRGDFFELPQAEDVDRNPTTRIEARIESSSWTNVDGFIQIDTLLRSVEKSGYIRVRGTNNGTELEPEKDPLGENPWADLWFYSNPVFIEVKE